MEIKLKLVSCLEKVFPNTEPKALVYPPEGLIGEETGFQIAFMGDGDSRREWVNLKIESEIASYITPYRVAVVPVLYPTVPGVDDDYLSKQPGLYPDPLLPLRDNRLNLYPDHWECAYLRIAPPDSLPAGSYDITCSLISGAGETLGRVTTTYRRIAAVLPEQKLIHTRWFHTDGICQYYGVEMFSEKFWSLCGNFMKGAKEMSVNCILTPIHTPPLDTQVGGERMTCQLVDVKKLGDTYEFGFDKLRRFVRLAKANGMKYFEMAHLFTQWGAAHAPKIMAEVNGEVKRIFGWETDATDPAYTAFLKQYLPAVKAELAALGILENTIFHISDEPNKTHIENYMAARNSIKEELAGCKVVDALSDFEMFESGAVEHPVPGIDHIRPFLDAKIPNLWAYYCCGQVDKVSNAFIAMPSRRTRIIGTQLFKYDIEGFLQWGYNFYNSQYSLYPVNPWFTTDGDGFSPAGDCCMVYPGEDGNPVKTLRTEAFLQAVQDLRAFQKLEQLTSKAAVMKLMEENIPPIEFDEYPRTDEYILELRRKVNAAIETALAK